MDGLGADKNGTATAVRKRRPPAERRAMITATALELFATRDFRSVTIRDIATACDINISLIYYYFRNKDDLFQASIEEAIRQAFDRYIALRGRADNPAEVLDGWFDINIELQETLARMAKVMVDYSFSQIRVASIDQMIADLYRHEIELLRESFEEGMRLGLFRKCDAAALAHFVSVHLDGVFFSSMHRPEANVARNIENLREILWAHLGYATNGRQSARALS